ncbi:MAG: spermidine synthase [Streptosporangiales bacterium]|nr:spermidine synthase [Streptosporangiales bacterium]
MASRRFAELDWCRTPMGELSLRRRREPVLDVDVYEIKLGDEFLMSSLFTVAEVELARLALAAHPGSTLDVAVGGLGLGYTAHAALEDRRVRSLTVIDALGEVIGWHERGLLPLGEELTADPRCHLVHGDFFATIAAPPRHRMHVILLDIDHAPGHVLRPSHADFYTPAGLRALTAHLHPGGVFGLWSNDPPDETFGAALTETFREWQAHVVTFHNHLQDRESANTVYVAIAP